MKRITLFMKESSLGQLSAHFRQLGLDVQDGARGTPSLWLLLIFSGLLGDLLPDQLYAHLETFKQFSIYTTPFGANDMDQMSIESIGLILAAFAVCKDKEEGKRMYTFFTSNHYRSAAFYYMHTGSPHC